MKTSATNPLDQKGVQVGLLFLVASCILFLATMKTSTGVGEPFSVTFFVNYVLTIIYYFIARSANKEATGTFFGAENFTRNVILLQLFNMSAYSLNRTIDVFFVSTDWLAVFLILSNIILILHAFRQKFSVSKLSHLIVIFSNLGIIFHLYQSLYVIPVYVSLVAFFFFGISLHILVPFIFFVTNILIVRKFLQASPKFWTSTLLTWVFALGIISFVSFRFHKINTIIQDSFHTSLKPYQDNSLPSWVKISQELPKDWFTKRALKSGIVYADNVSIGTSIGGRIGRFNERKKHDPLVVISSVFNGNIELPFNDRVKILQSMFDDRHKTEPKFWRGDNLSTSDIVTNVELFPDYRLAYTEKTFNIVNNKTTKNRWRNQQEALYTFYLPEGSVVTSAALWVNGEERPAYLTTKEKADKAYEAIVGRERRDPLLLHWQEGNRITVRVFPCTPQEDRQFKIGVTTPLRKKGDQLIYENIDFEGPSWKMATESINVVSPGSLSNMSTPYSFSENGTTYSYKGLYHSDWTLAFDVAPLSDKAFSFNGKSYNLEEYKRETETFDAQDIYLDINSAWSNRELNQIWEVVKNKNVFVYTDGQMQKLTTTNKKSLFNYLSRQNFTMFPFYKITNPATTLVISKYNQLTPTLSDIKKSAFMKQLSAFFQEQDAPIRLYNIGSEISPYLKTLKEIRSTQHESGSLEELVNLLGNNSFYKNQEDGRTVVNNYGAFQLKETVHFDSTLTSVAPDHLMRVYNYNDLLKTIGKDYYDKDALANELIDAAKESYVVTPISSLIVLETQADYDRFDIKKSKNSLQNAQIGNSGAVPEPHEWLLIILVFMMTLYFYYRR